MNRGGAGAADLRLLPVAATAWLGAGVAVAVPADGWTLAVAVGLWVLAAVLAVVRLPGAWRGMVVLALAGEPWRSRPSSRRRGSGRRRC